MRKEEYSPRPVQRRRGRGRLCAVCHFELRGGELQDMCWCKKDQFYACGRCWEDFCKKRHQATSADRGVSVYAMSVVLASFAAFLLPLCVPGIYDYYMVDKWNGMTETPVDQLPHIGAVKVHGMLNSSTEIALGYTENYDDDTGYYWEWDSNARFRVQDDSGSVQVVCSRYYDIRESGQHKSLTPHLTGPIYTNLTRVTIIGEMQVENGQKVLYLRTMAPGNEPLQADPWFLVPDFIIFPILFMATGYVVSAARTRNRLHGEKVRDTMPSEAPEDRIHKPTGVKWSVNAPSLPARRIRPFSIIFVLLGGFLLILSWQISFRKDGLFLLMFVDSLIALFLIAAPVAAGLYHTSLLTEVGTSERGIHFWYHTAGQRMLNAVFVPWYNVKDVGWMSSGKSRSWEIRLKDGGTLFPNLSPGNRSLLENEWASVKAKNSETEGNE